MCLLLFLGDMLSPALGERELPLPHMWPPLPRLSLSLLKQMEPVGQGCPNKMTPHSPTSTALSIGSTHLAINSQEMQLAFIIL